MATGQRWDPLRDVERMIGSLTSNALNSTAVPLDLYKSGDHYVITMDLPGVDPGSIDVSVEDRTLTVRAERSARADGDTQWLVRERPSGTFARQLTVGRGLALDKITASYQDGVLSLSVPVAEEAKPRRIQVNLEGQGSQNVLNSPADQSSVSGSQPQ